MVTRRCWKEYDNGLTGIGAGSSPIHELENHPILSLNLLKCVKSLPELDNAFRHNLDQSIEELSAVASLEASISGIQLIQQLLLPRIFKVLIEAIHPLQPVVWIVSIAIRRRHSPERLDNSRVNQSHAADGIGGEGDAGPDLAETAGLLVDLDLDAAADETQTQGQPDDAAPNYRDLNGPFRVTNNTRHFRGVMTEGVGVLRGCV